MTARHKRKAAAVATVALCLAASTSPTVSFQLLHPGRVTGSSRIARPHACRRWRQGSAAGACPVAMKSDGAGDGERPYAPAPVTQASPSHGSGGKGASKDVAALVLSAILLGSPDFASAAQTVGAIGQRVDTVSQDKLIADLENRLMKLPGGVADSSTSTSSVSAEREGVAASRDDAPRSGAGSAESSAKQQQQQQGESPVPPAAAAARSAPATSTAAQRTPSEAFKVGAVGSEEGVPLVKLQEYTFSVTVPELNLPPVGPITVPAEGGLFSGSAAKAERVSAAPSLPFGGMVRDALVSAGKGEGVARLVDSFKAIVPKQADYHRTVAEFEKRVHANVKTVDNPLFAPGVPLSPEFDSMLAQAKETAFRNVRPYLPKGVEPELALFMLATLPVLTVALRAADENSRKPKQAPLPEGYRPPRKVKFPNSPAKVDAEAVAEARAAAAAAAPVAVAAAVSGAQAVVAAAPVAAEVGAVTSAAADLEGGVAVAAATDPDRLREELKKLQRELSAAKELAAKVEALERANARLVAQVADLSKQPSLQEIQRRAEKEAARASLQKERLEKQAEFERGVAEKAAKLSAAREILADSFPSREAGASLGSSVAAEPVTAADRSAEATEAVVTELKTPAATKGKATAAAKKATNKKSTSTKKKTVAAPSGEPVTAAAGDGNNSGNDGAGAGKTAEKKPRKAAAGKAVAAKTRQGVAPPVNNGSVAPQSDADSEGLGVAATPPIMEKAATTPDEYDDLSEDLSRALRGVQGFDLDALDLEMDDLQPEELEELRNLEREIEMGDLDVGSLEADFDPEDDETISRALRMAAESAMAHTSGGGRRIRTASPVGATSARSAPAGGGGAGGGMFDGGDEGQAAAAAASAMRGSRTAIYEGEEEMTTEDRFSGPSEDFAALRRLEAGEEGVGAGAGAWAQDWDEWSNLSEAAVKKKTVAEIKEYLDEEGVAYPSKVKKADLVAIVCNYKSGSS